MFTMPRKGIVSVKMVITEEKILSNIDKIKKLINPKSKKQIIELEEDSYFKDLVESVKTYLIEYPKKKNFPKSVYDSAYELVEYATNLFEENTKQIEVLIKQREYNIQTAAIIKQTLALVQTGDEEWKQAIEDVSNRIPEDVIEALNIIGEAKDESSIEYQSAVKLINAKTLNLESNLHIEIDMERVEDRSKALSYIGIEVADALKLIPVPAENVEVAQNTIAQESIAVNGGAVNSYAPQQLQNEQQARPNLYVVNSNQTVNNQNQNAVVINTADNVQNNGAYQQYYADTRQEVKESVWEKFKRSKLFRAIKYAFKIRVRLSLPEGNIDK